MKKTVQKLQVIYLRSIIMYISKLFFPLDELSHTFKFTCGETAQRGSGKGNSQLIMSVCLEAGQSDSFNVNDRWLDTKSQRSSTFWCHLPLTQIGRCF